MPTQSKIPNANPAKKGLPGRRPGEPGTIVPVEGPAPSTRGVIPSEARNLSSRAAGSDANRREIPRAATTGPRDDSESDDRRQDAGATPDSSSPYGPNNEQLPDRLQEALRRLVFQFSTESELSRRQEIRRIKQAHQFWRGLQYLWWSERDQNWHLPFEQKLLDNSSIDKLPRYEFVTNIYQAFGLSLVSVLSQDVPRVRFFPSSAQAEEDVSAAKAATRSPASSRRTSASFASVDSGRDKLISRLLLAEPCHQNLNVSLSGSTPCKCHRNPRNPVIRNPVIPSRLGLACVLNLAGLAPAGN